MALIPQLASASEDRAPGGSKSGGSLRFDANNDYAAQSPHLKRTPSTAGNLRTWTISVWMRRSDVQEGFAEWFQAGEWATSPWYHTYFQGQEFHTYILGPSNSPNSDLHSTEHYYDASGWMHLVLVNDSTQSTNLERHRLYINGKRQSGYPDDTTYIPAQNFDGCVNGTAKEHRIGLSGSDSSPYEGYMSDFHMIDGQALEPTDFGYTDPFTVIWRPKKYVNTLGKSWPNTSREIWSGVFTSSGTSMSTTYPAVNVFDGNISSIGGNASNDSSNALAFAPPFQFTGVAKLRVRKDYVANQIELRIKADCTWGSWFDTPASSNADWIDITSEVSGGKVNGIEWRMKSGISNGIYLAAIEINGTILVDGGGSVSYTHLTLPTKA